MVTVEGLSITLNIFRLHEMHKLCRQYGDSVKSDTFCGDFMVESIVW